MDKKEIEKEIEKRIANADKKACVSPEIAEAIMGIEQPNNELTDTKDNSEVPICENDGNLDGVISEEKIADDAQGTTDKKEENKKNDDNNKHKYGKFKNPEELLKAYGELEREFTRRSQKLKELENVKKPVLSEEKWKDKVDKFFERTPSAIPFAKDIATKIMQNPELKDDENCLDVALNQVLLDNFKTPEQLMSDGQFLQDYVFNSPVVRNSIIASYLKEMREMQPPRTLSMDGINSVAPNRRPKSIEEAGFMFLKNNK